MNRREGCGRKWQLIIFDCDGVLVDSEPIQNRLFHSMLRDVGWALGYKETIEAFVGRSMKDCLLLAEQQLGQSLPRDFEARLQEQTFAAFESELRPVRGVEQALDAVSVPVCVASSGSIGKMRRTLTLAGLLTRFEGRLFSATQVPRGKPHPDLFLHAAREMRVGPLDCAVIEDSVPGVQAAVAAGMTAFGYADREGGDALAAAGATVFNDMRQLPALLQTRT